MPDEPKCDTEVLVVGAGPTGLMLAHELRCRGIGVRIVDANPDQLHESRALVVHARTLELLDKHGLAEPLVDQGRRTLGALIHVEKRRDLEIELGDIGVDDTPFPFILFVSQAETEKLLADALSRRGTQIERGTRLDSVAVTDDCVHATVSSERRDGGPGVVERIRARYLVGCDGAHSVVRKQLGLGFRGAPYEQEFVLADAILEGNLAANRLHFFLTRRGVLAAFPFAEHGLFRLIGSRAKKRAGDASPNATFSTRDVQALVDDLATVPFRVAELRWSSRYRLHHRAANHFQKGRAFLAGDAAHIHSPAGGQGMNTGMGDAANLAWKLAAVLRGQAGAALLDSYEIERLPVARRLLQYTDRLFWFATSRNPLFIRVRNALAPLLVTRALATRSRREKAFRFASQLAIRYDESPATLDLRDPKEESADGPNPGARAPDAPVARREGGDKTTLHAVMRGVLHSLVVFTDAEIPSVLAPPGTRCVLIRRRNARAAVAGYETFVDESGIAFQRYGVGRDATYLVRPDGYVAVRAANADVAAVLRAHARLYRTAPLQ